MLHSITQLKGTINTCLVNCSKWRVLYARITSPCIQQTFFSIEKCKIVSPFYSTQLVFPIVSFRRFYLRSSPYRVLLLFYSTNLLRFQIRTYYITLYTRQSTLDHRFFLVQRINFSFFHGNNYEELFKKGNTSEIGSNVRFNKNCIFASFIVTSIKEREKGRGERKRYKSKGKDSKEA